MERGPAFLGRIHRRGGGHKESFRDQVSRTRSCVVLKFT